MALTALEVARAARQGGFSLAETPIAVAIAYAESRWNPTATHRNNNGSTDYGLWQINSVHGFSELSDGSWRTPSVNATLAYRVYKSQGWGAWVTYNNNAYRSALSAGRLAAQGIGDAAESATSSATSAISDVTSAATAAVNAIAPIGEAASEFSTLAEWFSRGENWARIAKVVVGGVLIIIGVEVLIQPEIWKLGRTATRVVTGASPEANITRQVRRHTRDTDKQIWSDLQEAARKAEREAKAKAKSAAKGSGKESSSE